MEAIQPSRGMQLTSTPEAPREEESAMANASTGEPPALSRVASASPLFEVLPLASLSEACSSLTAPREAGSTIQQHRYREEEASSTGHPSGSWRGGHAALPPGARSPSAHAEATEANGLSQMKPRVRCLPLSVVTGLPFFLLLCVTTAVLATSVGMVLKRSIVALDQSLHDASLAHLDQLIEQRAIVAERAAMTYADVQENSERRFVANAPEVMPHLCGVLNDADPDAVIHTLYVYSVTEQEATLCSHGNDEATSLWDMAAEATHNSIHGDMLAIDRDSYEVLQPLVVVSRVAPGWENMTRNMLQLYGTPYIEPSFERYFAGVKDTIPRRVFWERRDNYHHMSSFSYPFNVYDTEAQLENRTKKGHAIIDAEADLSRLVTGNDWITQHGLARIRARREANHKEPLIQPLRASTPTMRLVNDGMGEKRPTFGDGPNEFVRVCILQEFFLDNTSDPVVVSNNWGQQSVNDASAWSAVFASEPPAYMHVSDIDDPVMKVLIRSVDLKALAKDGDIQTIQTRFSGRNTFVTARRYFTRNSMQVVYILASVNSIPTFKYFISFLVLDIATCFLFTLLFFFAVRHWITGPLRRLSRALAESSDTTRRVIHRGHVWGCACGIREIEDLYDIYNAAMTQIGLIDSFLPMTGAAHFFDDGEGSASDEAGRADSSDTQESIRTSALAAPSLSSSHTSARATPVMSNEERVAFLDSVLLQRSRYRPRSRPLNSSGPLGYRPTPTPDASSNSVPHREGTRTTAFHNITATTVTITILSIAVDDDLSQAGGTGIPDGLHQMYAETGSPFPTVQMLQSFMQLIADGGNKYDAAVPLLTPTYVQMVFFRHAAKVHQQLRAQQERANRKRRRLVVTIQDEASGEMTATPPRPTPPRQHSGNFSFAARIAAAAQKEMDEAIANDALDAAEFILTVHSSLTHLFDENRRSRRRQAPWTCTLPDDGHPPTMDLSATAPATAEPSQPPDSPTREPRMYALLNTRHVFSGWHASRDRDRCFPLFNTCDILRDITCVAGEIGASVLVTEPTYRLIAHAFRAIPLEAIQVEVVPEHGYGVVLYELLSGCATTPAWFQYLLHFCEAFGHMLRGRYAAALVEFDALARIDGIEPGMLSAQQRRLRREQSGEDLLPRPHVFAGSRAALEPPRTSQLDRLMRVCEARVAARDTTPYVRLPVPTQRADGAAASTTVGMANQSMSLRQMSRQHFCHARGASRHGVAALAGPPPPRPLAGAGVVMAPALLRARRDTADAAPRVRRLALTGCDDVAWFVPRDSDDGDGDGGEAAGDASASVASVDSALLAGAAGRCRIALSACGELGVWCVFALQAEQQAVLQRSPALAEHVCAVLFPGGLGSEHTVGFLGWHSHVARDAGAVGCVEQYHAGGTLRELLTRHGRRLPLAAAARHAACVFAGLRHLHAQGVVHGDVRPENVLVGAGCGAKLRGFFGDRRAAESVLVLRGSAYAGPEVARGLPASPESDVYGGGLVLLEAVTGQPPWRWSALSREAPAGEAAQAMVQLAAAAGTGGVQENPFAVAVRAGHVEVAMPPCVPVSAALMRVLDGCLVEDPARRLTAAEVCELFLNEQ